MSKLDLYFRSYRVNTILVLATTRLMCSRIGKYITITFTLEYWIKLYTTFLL